MIIPPYYPSPDMLGTAVRSAQRLILGDVTRIGCPTCWVFDSASTHPSLSALFHTSFRLLALHPCLNFLFSAQRIVLGLNLK